MDTATGRGDATPPPGAAKVLAACRFLLLAAVVGCVLLQLVLIVMAFALLARTATSVVTDIASAGGKDVILVAIEELDLFLLATVAWLTATGLYTLFIDPSAARWLRTGVDSLDDLKAKLIGVVVLALGVLFLGEALGGASGANLLYFGVAVAAVILALGVFVRARK